MKAGSVRRSGGQRIELICGGRDLPVEAVKLPFLDHVHSLNTSQQNARTTERLEAKHGPDDALDGPMILLDDVVQILHLTQFNRRAGISLNGLNGSRVGGTLVDGDLVGQAVLTDGAFQEAARCSQIAFGRKHEVDSGAVTVDGAIEILPFSSCCRLAACGDGRVAASTGRILSAQRWMIV